MIARLACGLLTLGLSAPVMSCKQAELVVTPCSWGVSFAPPSIDSSQGILVQEYWSAGKPRFLIHNTNATDRSIEIYEQHNFYSSDCSCGCASASTSYDTRIRRLVGPLTVPSQDWIDINAESLQVSTYNQLGFYLTGGATFGNLPSPSLESVPVGARLIVQNSINQAAWGDAYRWLEADSLMVTAATEFHPTIRVRSDFEVVEIPKFVPSTWGVPSLASVQVLDAVSVTLRVEEISDRFLVYRDSADPDAIHDIELRVLAPVTAQTILAQLGFLARSFNASDPYVIAGFLIQP